jgi:hypothetical protein
MNHGLVIVLPVVFGLCAVPSWTLIVDVWLVGLLEILVVMRLWVEGVVAVLSVGPLRMRVVVVIVVVVRAVGDVLY